MRIADCGHNGDQLVRLFESPAKLFVVQFVGVVSEMVIKDVEGAKINRLAMWFFIGFYVALDAESGVATGMQLQYNSGLEAAQKDIVVRAVDAQNNGLVTTLVVVREELSELNTSLDGLLAIVSMKPITAPVPCFDRDDIEGIADLIIRHYPKRSTA